MGSPIAGGRLPDTSTLFLNKKQHLRDERDGSGEDVDNEEARRKRAPGRNGIWPLPDEENKDALFLLDRRRCRCAGCYA